MILVLLGFLLLGAFARSGRVFLAVLIVPAWFVGMLLGFWGDPGDDSPVATAVSGALVFAAIAAALIFVGVFAGGWTRDLLEAARSRNPRG